MSIELIQNILQQYVITENEVSIRYVNGDNVGYTVYDSDGEIEYFGSVSIPCNLLPIALCPERFYFGVSNFIAENPINEQCQICENSDTVYALHDNHYMCKDCIMKLRKFECPFCRKPLEKEKFYK